MVARAGTRDPSHTGGAWNWLRSLQPFRQRLSDRCDLFQDRVRQTDFRNTVPRFSAEARDANQALVDAIGKIAEQKGATKAQVALAWLLAQRPWIVPIPGTTKLHRLEENLGGAAVELTAENLDAIQDVLSKIEVQGARYSAQMQSLVNR